MRCDSIRCVAIKLRLARWVPRRVLAWCVIQAWVYATTERYTDKSPDEVTWDMVVKHLRGEACN